VRVCRGSRSSIRCRTIREVLTDNGVCHRAKVFAATCAELGLKHRRTRPYTPRTNGKAERFIQSALREWAYARAYGTSAQRISALPRWLHGYNWHRPHASLVGQPPTSRLGLDRNNLLRLHTARGRLPRSGGRRDVRAATPEESRQECAMGDGAGAPRGWGPQPLRPSPEHPESLLRVHSRESHGGLAHGLDLGAVGAADGAVARHCRDCDCVRRSVRDREFSKPLEAASEPC
jgi:Integrase core domain